jgi:hypothetical protein
VSPEHGRKVAEDALGKGEVSFRSLLQHVLESWPSSTPTAPYAT